MLSLDDAVLEAERRSRLWMPNPLVEIPLSAAVEEEPLTGLA